jgi:hypothetical protein
LPGPSPEGPVKNRRLRKTEEQGNVGKRKIATGDVLQGEALA